MHPDPPKQLETIKIKNPIRFSKPSSPNIPTSIRTHPNLPNRCNQIKYTQINRKVSNPTESMQINPNRLKSSRDHQHLPKHNETQLNRQIATKSIHIRVDQRTRNASIIESQDCPLSPTTQTITDHAK